MKHRILLVVLLIFVVYCRGYRGQARERTQQELQVAALASELSDRADQLQKQAPVELAAKATEFAETSLRFDNASQRFGPNSLEARDAYDRLFYHAKRLDEQITKESYPKLFDDWQSIQKDYIKKIGVMLGYRAKG